MADSSPPTAAFLFSFQAGLRLEPQVDGGVVLRGDRFALPVNPPSPGIVAVLEALAAGTATEDDLYEIVGRLDGPLRLPELAYYLRYFIQAGLICYVVAGSPGRLATLVPLTTGTEPPAARLDPDHLYQLSRFAYIRREAEDLILETPLAPIRVILHDQWAMALIHRLAQPCRLADLTEIGGDLPEAVPTSLLTLLYYAQVVAELPEAAAESPEARALTQWSFHDLLFHTRSRLGRHANPYGATYPFLNQIPPLPALKPAMTGEAVALDDPDMTALMATDAPFAAVVEQRRSERRHAADPISLAQLSEFLYRVGRVRRYVAEARLPYDYTSRPYPGGGACYELEIYPLVHRCTGLAEGLYHYHPAEHRLYRLAGRTNQVEALLAQTRMATGEASADSPHILLILAARFQRVAWKYDSMAYAAILKHVGVLYQTMYLTATVMGLAGCALGGGNADLFAAAAGTNYYVETSVGEFILGRKRLETEGGNNDQYQPQ